MAYIFGEQKKRPRPEPPTEADREAAEQARLERRAAIRRQLAERQILELRANELRGEVAATEARLEGLAASHEAAMQPLQVELKAVNQNLVEALAARHQPNAKTTARRRELLDELAAANRQLAADLEIEKQLLRSLKAEATQAAGLTSDWRVSESDLAKIDVANPQLLIASFVAKQAHQWAAARRDAARKTLAEQREALAALRGREGWDADDQRTEAIYEARIARWHAEVAAAEAALAGAAAASEAAVRALIDE